MNVIKYHNEACAQVDKRLMMTTNTQTSYWILFQFERYIILRLKREMKILKTDIKTLFK